MNLWNQIPFLRLLLPFLAGILSAVYSGAQINYTEYILTVFFLSISIFILIKRLNVSYNYSWVFGTIATSAVFLFGFQLTVMNTSKFDAEHFSKFENADLYRVKINSTLLEKEKSYKVTVTITGLKKNEKWIPVTGKAMCYFKKDSTSKNIRYGDCLLLKTNFTEIKAPQNPGEFNYKRFLSFHNIYHQTYIPTENWKSLSLNEGNKIIRASIAIREYLLNIYKKNNIQGDELAVGSALVLGYTDNLDQDLINAYASSGALHVLSVSGLHVGIIYLICNYLLFFLDKFKHGKFIKMILLLFILWFYATLTGLSPSVLRSTVMFSFVVIAKTWRYNTNIINTLAASCFALLLYNPYLIMEVGFQLSYLAVLGIVIIQPWIYEKWEPKSWLTNQIWLITSVSIAAQLATFPLGLLYFHQFPNYFLFSNLLVIPISTLILGYGLLMFVLGKISTIGITCGKIFSGLVWFLNESVRMVDKTPGSLLHGISISILETWIIYFIVIFLLLYVYKKEFRFLTLSLCTTILLLFIQTIEANSIKHQNTIIIYNAPKIAAYDFIHEKHTVFLADSALIHNPSRMLFHIKHNWWDRNITKQETLEKEKLAAFYNSNISIRNNFIQFKNKRIAIVNSSLQHASTPFQKLAVDLIVISKNSKVEIEDIQKQFNFSKIIIDSSNSEWNSNKWKNKCKKLNIDFYSVLDSGAYIEEI